MRLGPVLLSTLLMAAGIAGCLSDDTDGGDPSNGVGEATFYDATAQRYVQSFGPDLNLRWAPGALSTLTNAGSATISVTMPSGWLEVVNTLQGGSTFALTDAALDMAAGQTRTFLAPPSTTNLGSVNTSGAGGPQSFDLEIPAGDADPEDELISGENTWDLSAYQEEHFPHREPCHPLGNYAKSAEYFAQYFRDLGFEVEKDPYGTTEATTASGCSPAGLNSFGPESFSNVVATLPGTDPDAPTIFVSGGHYDMVPQTTHAAFDDTSGVVGTMELARVMSQFEWKHTLKFALWGGEENGILGSQFWVQTNPDARNEITVYWNLDVVGMSWPAPLVKPDPIVIAAGPDGPAPSDDPSDPTGNEGQAAGPVSDELLRFAQELQQEWFGFPEGSDDGEDWWYYEGIGSGQVSGYAGVNAQSDHTPFAAAGIPAYFIFNGDTLAADNPIGIHNERDTLENMTRYAFFGGPATEEILTEEEDKQTPYVWDPEDYETAKDALADSWETILWFPFYSSVLQDVGYWYSPGPAGQSQMVRDEAPTAPS